MLSAHAPRQRDDDFFLAQLDVDFSAPTRICIRPARSCGWYRLRPPVLIDKNRLAATSVPARAGPDARLLVCGRGWASVRFSRAQHQRDLIDFPDHTANHDRYNRADTLFAKDGVIGNPLRAIEAIQDLAKDVQQRIRLVAFEHLMRDPAAEMADVFAWLELPDQRIDPNNLGVRQHESDSHYRHKYPHRQHAAIEAPPQHTIPARIQGEIERTYAWYYDHIYPDWKRLSAPPKA